MGYGFVWGKDGGGRREEGPARPRKGATWAGMTTGTIASAALRNSARRCTFGWTAAGPSHHSASQQVESTGNKKMGEKAAARKLFGMCKKKKRERESDHKHKQDARQMCTKATLRGQCQAKRANMLKVAGCCGSFVFFFVAFSVSFSCSLCSRPCSALDLALSLSLERHN